MGDNQFLAMIRHVLARKVALEKPNARMRAAATRGRVPRQKRMIAHPVADLPVETVAAALDRSSLVKQFADADVFQRGSTRICHDNQPI
jgi:hypothetical protein